MCSDVLNTSQTFKFVDSPKTLKFKLIKIFNNIKRCNMNKKKNLQ